MLGGISVLGQLEVLLDKGVVDGLQLGMGGGSILDLGDCPHTVFVLLQLPAERGGGLVQVRNCGIQILNGVQRMGFQIVHRPFDFLKVPNSAFQFCLARPITALLIAEIEVVHQQVGQRGLFRLFQSVQKKPLLFVQVCDPVLQTTNCTADGLHQAVGGSNVPVEISEKCFDSPFFHLVCSRAEMNGRYLLDAALPLKGAQVNTFRSASSLQIAVCDGLPTVPPDLGILLVVPVHRVFLVALPVARRELDALAVLVKVVDLSGFWKPLAVRVHCPERQQNVGVWVSIFLVVNGKVGDHALGNKLLLTKFLYHGEILFFRNLHRKCQHDAPGKLGVPLVLHGFHGVPEGCPVCISGRRMGRQHDFGMDKFFLLVVEFRFLVVLVEQPFAALVSGPGNSGLPLAALNDGNFEMRTRNRHHPLMTFESFSCKNHGIMVLLFWISKQKAGEPMSERKSQQELDFERKHEEDLQRLRGLRLIDDDFMAAVFEERACAEFLLQIILKRNDLTVKEVHGQYSIKNLQGRSVRLDILAVDRENRAYNIEVQRSDRGASEKRARYNSSLLDANLTDAGDDYDALNETYVIFITENDVLKAGLPIYHVDRTVRETGTFFNDQAHIVYVNSQIKDETALGKLMHDFFCTNSKDMNYSILAQRVRYFKEDTKGVAAMCRAMEKMRDETEHETSVKHALAMLADGVPCEKVAKYTDLSIEEVRALAEKKSA